MPVYSASRLDRIFAQVMTSLRVIPNTSGTWSNTGAILTRHQSLTLTTNNPVSERPDKTGTRSTLRGLSGRKSGTFSFSAPLIPNGAAGVVPDLDPILQAVFGQAATVVASTSATYSFFDTGYLSFALLRFNRSGGTNPTHFIAGGCIPQRVTFTLGGEYLMMSVDGKCVYPSDSTNLANYTGNDLPAAFGLTAWPAEPTSGAPVTVNGNPIQGFGGTATFGGNSEADLRAQPVFTVNTGLEFAEDGYLDAYPFAILGGKRTITINSLKCIDNDGTALDALKQYAFTKTPFNIAIAVNNVAGSTVTLTLKNVQLGAASLVENGAAFDINFGDSPAHASSISAIDDFSLAFS